MTQHNPGIIKHEILNFIFNTELDIDYRIKVVQIALEGLPDNELDDTYLSILDEAVCDEYAPKWSETRDEEYCNECEELNKETKITSVLAQSTLSLKAIHGLLKGWLAANPL